MARTPKADEPQLFEATTSIASEWIAHNALNDFPGGVCQQGTIVRAGHPILKAHAQFSSLAAPTWVRACQRGDGKRYERGLRTPPRPRHGGP